MTGFRLRAGLRLLGMTCAVGLLAASCVQEAGDELPGGADGRAIAFTPQATDTRALVNTAEDMKEFSVWGWYEADGAQREVFDGVTVSHSAGSGWTYDTEKYWVPGHAYRFYAAYPVTAAISCTEEGRLTVEDFDCTGGDDLMTAASEVITPQVNVNPGAVNLPFTHELARVSVRVRTDQGVSVVVSGASLYGFPVTGTLTRDYGNGGEPAWERGAGTTAQSPAFSLENGPLSLQPASEEGLFDDLLLIPQESLRGLRLSLTYRRTGEQGQTQELALSDYISKWEAGKAYRYVLTIKADAITFGEFTVDEWGESHAGGDINVGE